MASIPGIFARMAWQWCDALLSLIHMPALHAGLDTPEGGRHYKGVLHCLGCVALYLEGCGT